MRRALVSLFLPMLALAACPSVNDDPVVCLEAGSFAPCTPPYEPTYDNVYANVFQPTCAKSGFSCHSPNGRQGGLDYFDKDAVYGEMLGRSVHAGSPECSVLVQRVIATDGLRRMPPGASIPEAQQCAIIQWVAAGARR